MVIVWIIEYIHPKLLHVFNKLRFYKDTGGLYKNYGAIIMIDALNEYLKEIEKIACEIDNEYESDNTKEAEALPCEIKVIFED